MTQQPGEMDTGTEPIVDLRDEIFHPATVSLSADGQSLSILKNDLSGPLGQQAETWQRLPETALAEAETAVKKAAAAKAAKPFEWNAEELAKTEACRRAAVEAKAEAQRRAAESAKAEAERRVRLATADADAARRTGEARAAAQAQWLRVHGEADASTLRALAVDRLAENLPRVDSVTVSPDVLTGLLASLGRQGGERA